MTAMGGPVFLRVANFMSQRPGTHIERAKGGTGLLITGVSTIQEMYGRGYWLNKSKDVFLGPIKDLMKEIQARTPSFSCKLAQAWGAF